MKRNVLLTYHTKGYHVEKLSRDFNHKFSLLLYDTDIDTTKILI